MQLNPRRVILVGDQRQLPATTFSFDADRSGFSRSLFERLLQAGISHTMLETQYRMHPSLSAFPSRQFYESRIKNDASVQQREVPSELCDFEKVMQGRRLLFIDLVSSREHSDNSKSKFNPAEAAATVGLVKLLSKKADSDMIGVITPYKSQVRLLSKKCGDVEVNTVDAF